MAHVQALKTLEDEDFRLKETLHDSIQQDMQVVFGVHDQVTEHAGKFCHTTLISVKGLNPFQTSPIEKPVGDLGTPTPGVLA